MVEWEVINKLIMGKYSFKVWATTLVIAPVILMIFSLFHDGRFEFGVEMFYLFFFIPLGLLSAPCFLAFYLITYFTQTLIGKDLYKIILYLIMAALITISTIYFMFFNNEFHTPLSFQVKLYLSYLIPAVFSVLYYKFDKYEDPKKFTFKYSKFE